MLLIGVVAGLLLGLAGGGRLVNLLSVQFRYGLLIFLALILRFGTQSLLEQGVGVAETLRFPLFALSFGLLVATLWLNRSQPGLLLGMVGVALNGVAILLNGGWMPVYEPAVAVAGLSPSDLSPAFFVPLPETLGLEFVLRGGPIGDVLPLPLPLLANVISIGDVLLAAGIAWFLFTAISKGSPDASRGVVSLWRGSPQTAPEPTVDLVALDRPVVLGGGMGPGLATVAASEATRSSLASTVGIPLPRPTWAIASGRIRMSDWPAMPASPRSGWQARSASSATGFIRSPSA